jgi:ABC-type branched-subunit amino acid transport system ATPase component
VLGAILVPVGFEEITRFIPTSNNLPPNLIPSLEWVAIGLLIVIFLWVRPQGILPERKRFIRLPGPATTGAASAGWRGSVTADTVGPETREVDGNGQPPVVLEARDVVREFGGVRAVDGVSFAVRKGTLTGLIGPNGAGKSTLLAMLAGTLPVSSGHIIYEGGDITSVPAFKRARLGLVRTFQLASEFKRLTVMENLLSAVPGNRGDSLRGALLGRRYWRGDEDAAVRRAAALLDRFGLAELANAYAGDLSGGQRRLVEIMRALMAEPATLLLDEPMAGVHPNLARRIGAELVALCAEGMTILMVEHELAIMDEFCDPVVVMAEGRVLAEGTMQQLRGRTEVVEAYLVG